MLFFIKYLNQTERTAVYFLVQNRDIFVYGQRRTGIKIKKVVGFYCGLSRNHLVLRWHHCWMSAFSFRRRANIQDWILEGGSWIRCMFLSTRLWNGL